MSAATGSRRRRWVLLAGVVVTAAVIGGLVWFFSGDEPEEVDAERALQQDQDSLSEVFTPDLELPNGDGDDDPDDGGDDDGPNGTDPDVDGTDDEDPDDADPDDPDEDPAGAPRTAEDLDGTWIVDTSRGFDRAAGRGTFIGYRIEEELQGVGATTAVGRSPTVEGEVTFVGLVVASVVIEGDLTDLESDDGRRDTRVRSQLGPDATATFELTEPIELPEVPPVSEVIELAATGDLTLLDVTREVDVALQAAVTESGLLITGSTVVALSDFDVEVPSAPIVLSVSDDATLEWQLFLVKG